jgi:hypothetical protein
VAASASPTESISDLKTLLIDYAKQETLGPLRSSKRYLVFGLSGALLVGSGLFFLALAGLRALQTETGTTFTGNWSWAPYAIVLVGLVLAIFILSRFIKAGTKR